MDCRDELFESIFNEFKDSVYGYLVQSVSREDAKDLVQETFIKIYRSIGKFDPRRSAAAWVYAIARNVLYDFLRKYRKRNPQDLDERDYEDGSAKDLDESIEIRNAVNRLSSDHREVIVLYYMQDLLYEEVAEVLGCPVNTVKSRLSRAKRELRSILEDEIDSDINKSKNERLRTKTKKH